MAITACSAKVFSSPIWLSENPPRSRLPVERAPIAEPPRISGTITNDFAVMPLKDGIYTRFRFQIIDANYLLVEDRTARRYVGRCRHWEQRLDGLPDLGII